MNRKHPQNNAALVRALVEANVEFIVIGGVAAILHGERTHDVLPTGPTGIYWADGVAVQSSFADR